MIALDKIENAVIAAAALEFGIMLLPLKVIDAVESIAYRCKKHHETGAGR
jgi:hypothetical protein